MSIAIVEFLTALLPSWLAWRATGVRVVARNGKPRTLLVVMHIAGLVLLWMVWKLYEIETRPAADKK